MNKSVITFLGTRGSIPVSGKDFDVYGGFTTCIMLEMAGQTILLDGGNGLLNAGGFFAPGTKHVTMLMTHAHIDHILGFTSFPMFFGGDIRFDIMGQPLMGKSVRQQIEMLMCPPIWPVSPDSYSDKVKFYDISEKKLMLGDVLVELMDGSHPGEATVYRLTSGGRTIVFCTDFEHNDSNALKNLIEFTNGVDLFIFDGMYTDDEYEKKRGWGHSTWRQGAHIAQRCGVKKLVISHHAPNRTDAQLAEFEKELQEINPAYSFAKANERIVLG